MLLTTRICMFKKKNIINKSSKTGVVVFILGALSFTPAFANEAVVLLNKMNHALRTLEYEGKLVYLKDGEASNLSIRHTIENGAEKEVIFPLDETADAYIKESNAFSLSGLPKITEKMQQVYSFDLGEMAKVAGRPCRIVLARPKDRKRYLQKYCIDLDRSILLKYSLINQHHQPVERFMFTDFDLISSRKQVKKVQKERVKGKQAPGLTTHQPIEVSDTDFAPAPGSAKMKALTHSLAPVAVNNDEMLAAEAKHQVDLVEEKEMLSPGDSSPDQYSEWFFETLPAGFNIVSADQVRNAASEDEQIVISDGLSSVSVFISTDQGVTHQIKPIQSGALNILSKAYQGHTITLVGEVPESTLEDIFKGIKKTTTE